MIADEEWCFSDNYQTPPLATYARVFQVEEGVLTEFEIEHVFGGEKVDRRENPSTWAKMLIDTGANYAMVTPELSKLGSKPKTVPMVTGETIKSVEMNMEVAGTMITTRAIVVDRKSKQITKRYPGEGLLGKKEVSQVGLFQELNNYYSK